MAKVKALLATAWAKVKALATTVRTFLSAKDRVVRLREWFDRHPYARTAGLVTGAVAVLFSMGINWTVVGLYLMVGLSHLFSALLILGEAALVIGIATVLFMWAYYWLAYEKEEAAA